MLVASHRHANIRQRIVYKHCNVKMKNKCSESSARLEWLKVVAKYGRYFFLLLFLFNFNVKGGILKNCSQDVSTELNILKLNGLNQVINIEESGNHTIFVAFVWEFCIGKCGTLKKKKGIGVM